MLAKNALLLIVVLLFGCEPYKRVHLLGTSNTKLGNSVGSDGGGNGGRVPIPTEKPTELILATDKLKGDSSPYKAVIKYGGAQIDQEFTPAGASQVQIPLPGLPAEESGVMTIELYQGGQLKFVAKRAHTRLEKNQANRVLVDSCLILAVPWFGAQHDGSCDWEIADK